ncbi:unnamed protein product [Protopolystoma xenopodis]|uniref:EGF-like domain-containing protein n=1 Tax=Protopolystoma xenopodis TaxID=117903 RepID=A0A3S4ZR50_9PLAT|nr:unnamed protein product [Protopolystoma xenopodis]
MGRHDCICPDGWNGTDCNQDINECRLGPRSPCEHGGICINTVSYLSLLP